MYIQFSKDINKIRNTFFWFVTVRELIVGGAFTITGFILYQIFKSQVRPYKTENLYAHIEKEIKKQEVKQIAVSYKNSKTKNTVGKKAQKRAPENGSAKHTVSGHEKRRYMHGKGRLLH